VQQPSAKKTRLRADYPQFDVTLFKQKHCEQNVGKISRLLSKVGDPGRNQIFGKTVKRDFGFILYARPS
jgi:hypothetical protein